MGPTVDIKRKPEVSLPFWANLFELRSFSFTSGKEEMRGGVGAVSYTHLTLPTRRTV